MTAAALLAAQHPLWVAAVIGPLAGLSGPLLVVGFVVCVVCAVYFGAGLRRGKK